MYGKYDYLRVAAGVALLVLAIGLVLLSLSLWR